MFVPRKLRAPPREVASAYCGESTGVVAGAVGVSVAALRPRGLLSLAQVGAFTRALELLPVRPELFLDGADSPD